MRIFGSIILATFLLLCGFFIGVLTINSVTDTETAVTRTEVTVMPVYRSLALSNRYAGIITDVSERSLNAPRTGTITKHMGSDVADGVAILELDTVPLIAVVSEVPFWRNLTLGAEGPDVESLERFLARLNYLDESEIDRVYNAHTVLAVERWREYNGIPGEIDPGPLTLFAIPLDIQYRFETSSGVGDYLLEHEVVGRIVAAERSIVVSIPVGDLSEISLPASVEWRLPGSTISGSGNLVTIDKEITIANSGLLVQTGNVEIDDRALSRRMPVGSPLEVRVTTAMRDNVLTVPVGLLTADASGQPALLVDNGEPDPTLTRVEVGLVAEGYAEIHAGVGPETQIVVPFQ